MYLLHVPNDKIPMSETMEGIQALYLEGKFQQVCVLSSAPFVIVANNLSSDSPISLPSKSKSATI